MTSLHDPDAITLPEIERLKNELLLYNPELWAQTREEIAQAYIVGAKSILDKQGAK